MLVRATVIGSIFAFAGARALGQARETYLRTQLTQLVQSMECSSRGDSRSSTVLQIDPAYESRPDGSKIFVGVNVTHETLDPAKPLGGRVVPEGVALSADRNTLMLSYRTRAAQKASLVIKLKLSSGRVSHEAWLHYQRTPGQGQMDVSTPLVCLTAP